MPLLLLASYFTKLKHCADFAYELTNHTEAAVPCYLKKWVRINQIFSIRGTVQKTVLK